MNTLGGIITALVIAASLQVLCGLWRWWLAHVREKARSQRYPICSRERWP